MRLGLIGIGALLIIAVWLFNKIQERRIAKGMEGRFANDSSDVLLNEQDDASTLREPRFEPAARRSGERFEPSLGGSEAFDESEHVPFPNTAAPVSEAAPRAPEVDAAIHAVMTLTLEAPIRGERLMTALHGLRHAGRHQVVVEGETTLGWTPLDPVQHYDTVRIGVQLANRSGALNEIEFSEFVAALQQQAEALGAVCAAPDMMETMVAARALDARCAALDASIGINVAAPEGAWPVSRVAEFARNQGFSARPDHRFAALDSHGMALFTLQDGDGGPLLGEQAKSSTQRITFLLEVPRANRAERPFERMQEAALACAAQLQGVVVDDQLRTLTEAALASIGRQIEPVYDQLEAQGLAAGSVRALALFR
jgi:hypothetical protein